MKTKGSFSVHFLVMAVLALMATPVFSQSFIIDDYETDGGLCDTVFIFEADVQDEGTFNADERVMISGMFGDQCLTAVDGVGVFGRTAIFGAEAPIQFMIYTYDSPQDFSAYPIMNLDVLDYTDPPRLTVFYVVLDAHGNEVFIDAPLLPDGTAPWDLSQENIDLTQVTLFGLYALWGDLDYAPQYVVFDNFRLETLDSDGDGVPDAEDACPNSDLSPTLIINGVDTGIVNVLFENGCTMADQVADVLANATHSDLVAMAKQWKKDGLISGREFGQIVSTAASGG